MDEVFPGEPFLKKIGFNLTDHLERVRHQIDNKDINKIDDETHKVAATSYPTRLAYRKVPQEVL